MTGLLKDFKAFLLRGNIVELAVAFVIGSAFAVLVKSFVDNVLMQIVAYIVGKNDFRDVVLGRIHLGLFINDAITFVSVAAAVFFFVVKPLQAMEARRRAGDLPADEVPELSTEEQLLTEIRDLLQKQA